MARKVIDFGGASPACVSCHKDQHKGDYGRTCDACHRPDTFKAAGFTHPRSPEFYAGRHAGVACVKCHTRPADIQAARAGLPAVPPRAKNPATTCDTCHADPHLGQVGTACERCHAIDAAEIRAGEVQPRRREVHALGPAQDRRVHQVPSVRNARVSIGNGHRQASQRDLGRVPLVPQGSAPRTGGLAVRHLPRDSVVQAAGLHAPRDGRPLHQLPRQAALPRAVTRPKRASFPPGRARPCASSWTDLRGLSPVHLMP